MRLFSRGKKPHRGKREPELLLLPDLIRQKTTPDKRRIFHKFFPILASPETGTV
ncbi:MAG: hypothetical protein MJ033_01275 [Victivallaceae bacterium]|nr:hypothetical protein [Victivallaceae bacterium]